MAKRGRTAGGVLSIVGGSLLIITGLILLKIKSTMLIYSFEIINIIRMIVTISCGVLGIVGGILAVQDSNTGSILALVGGAIASLGIFICIGTMLVGSITIPVFLIYTFIFIDPFLALSGGITATAVGPEL